jgi:hypothetical protein
MPVPYMAPRRPTRWPMFIMLVLTLIAAAAALAAWLRPMSSNQSSAPPAPSFSDQRVAGAKSRVCAGYQKIHRALDANSTRNGGGDPAGQLAVAVNARQIYVAGSAYLLTVLADEPATPSDLAASARKLARLFQILALDGLAADPSVQAHNAADQTLETIQGLCK